MILFIRTEAPDAEIGLRDGDRLIERHVWPAGRQLSVQLLGEIKRLLHRHRVGWADLTGIVVYAGPGSFTGLRIGFTVANALSYSLGLSVAAAGGDDWPVRAGRQLTANSSFHPVLPQYGGSINITLPKR